MEAVVWVNRGRARACPPRGVGRVGLGVAPGVNVVEDDVPSRLGPDRDEKPGDDPGNSDGEGHPGARREACG